MATAILTTSFNGDACPEEIAAQITLGVLTGNPFTRSLRLINTEHAAYTTLLAGPTGMDWVAEGAPLPTIDVGDDSYTVVPCKLAGVFDVSSESFDDSALDMGAAFVEALTEATASVLEVGPRHLHDVGDAGDQTRTIPLGVSVEGGDPGLLPGSLSPTDPVM